MVCYKQDFLKRLRGTLRAGSTTPVAITNNASSAAVLIVRSPPANGVDKPSVKFDDDFDNGFACYRLVAGNGG